jgi:hypothetical protein
VVDSNNVKSSVLFTTILICFATMPFVSFLKKWGEKLVEFVRMCEELYSMIKVYIDSY